MLGELLVGRFCAPGTRRRLAFPLVAAMGAPLLALVFRPPLPLAGLALLACGTGFAYQLGIQQAFLDSLPEGRRGQGFGLNSTGAMGGQGLTPTAAGALAGALGAAAAMAIAGAATILAAFALRGPLKGSAPPNVSGQQRATPIREQLPLQTWREVRRAPGRRYFFFRPIPGRMLILMVRTARSPGAGVRARCSGCHCSLVARLCRDLSP
jgi:hypothetical protein